MIIKTGSGARSLIQAQLDQHSHGILSALAPLEPSAAFIAWSETLRAIEELINLPMELDDPVVSRTLLSLSLQGGHTSQRQLKFVLHHLDYLYGAAVCARQRKLFLQLSAMQMSFALHGMSEGAIGLMSVGSAVDYLQSRRRHLLSLCYLIPSSCRGNHKLTLLDALNYMMPQAEISGTTITGLLQNRALADLYTDFTLFLDARGFRVSHSYPTLNDMYLEAERVQISDVAAVAKLDTNLESVPRDKVFSPAELRNNILLLRAAYAEFELDKTAFGGLADVIGELSLRTNDDYWVSVSRETLFALTQKHGVKPIHFDQLIFGGTTFVEAMNSYAPFVQVGDVLQSSVSLLSRFLYNFKNFCLYSKRRFQIRSGFIFEERVKLELSEQGFAIQAIKRIERKEFDVIAVRNGIVFNIQCKNNLVDPTWIDLDPVRFVRTNRVLERYYEKAISKERAREHLLKQHLGLDQIEPFVVTCFPIATDNPRIIPMARIRDFSSLASKLVSS